MLESEDSQSPSESVVGGDSPRETDAGEMLASGIEQAFQELDQSNDKSFCLKGEKVVCDKEELKEEIMMMTAAVVQEICD